MSDVVPPFKRNFSDCSPHMAKSLRESIQNDIDTSERNKTFCLRCYHVFTISLPDLSLYPEGFRHFYLMNVVDADVRQDLQDNKIINWCRTAKTLYPLKTKGDGNCLLHAVSLYMWGLEDDLLLLRRLLYVTLVQDTQTNFKRRWLLRQRRLNQERPSGFSTRCDSNETDREWETIMNSAIDQEQAGAFLPYDTLEAVHLYVLCNILRRPIIVLANKNVRSVYGTQVQECNLSGIYLPLEWKSEDVYHSPILLGYSMNHFVPLITKLSSESDSSNEPFVPLVLADFTPLIVQFLLPEEERIVQDLIKMYLKTKSVPLTTQDSILPIPAAKLELQTIQDHHNLVQDHLSDCIQIYGYWTKQPSHITRSQPSHITRSQPSHIAHSQPSVFVNDEVRWVNESTGSVTCDQKCHNEGCEMTGTPSIAGYCYKCFYDYTKGFKVNEENQARLKEMYTPPTAPPASMPSNVYEMSMMEEQCVNKCGNRASTKTYPYCHECLPKETPQHPPPSFPHLSLQGTANKKTEEIVDDLSLFGGGLPRPHSGVSTPVQSENSFNRLEPGSSRICGTPNCKQNCLTLQANKCAKCFVTTGHTDFQNECHPESRQRESGRSEPSSQTFLLNDPHDPPALRSFNMDDLRCKTTNCKNPPHFYLEGYCNECAEKERLRKKQPPPISVRTSDKREDKVVQTSMITTTNEGKNICLTPGCFSPILEGGLCRTCLAASKRHSDSMEVEQLMESATPCHLPPAEEVNPIIRSHKEKIKCASPICENFIYPPHQMCDQCTAILSEAHARSRSTEHRRLSPVQHGPCYSPSRQRCKTHGCQYYGDQRTQGYCSKCYEKDKKDKMRPLRQQSVKGRNCVEPGCDKYGDESMNYRCTFHYNIYHGLYANGIETPKRPTSTQSSQTSRTAPLQSNRTVPPVYSSGPPAPRPHTTPQYMLPSQIERYNVPEREPMNDLSRPGSSSGVEHKYNQAMSRVERERRSIRTCKTQDCSNFGNTQKEGYCNSCYTEIQRQRLLANSGTGPRHDDSYCC